MLDHNSGLERNQFSELVWVWDVCPKATGQLGTTGQPLIPGKARTGPKENQHARDHFQTRRLLDLIKEYGKKSIITKQLTKLEQARLEHLAYYDLALDILGGADVLSSVAEIAENIPNLRIIIDHLGAPSINGQSPDRIWTEAMQLLAQQANIYCKVSGLVESVADKTQPIPHEVEFYKPVLNLLWNKL